MKLNFESASVQSDKIPHVPRFAIGLYNGRELDPMKRAIREAAVIVTHFVLRSKVERIDTYI